MCFFLVILGGFERFIGDFLEVHGGGGGGDVWKRKRKKTWNNAHMRLGSYEMVINH